METKNIFTAVESTSPPRSVFDLSHDIKMSAKFDYLYPTCVLEVIPGDRFSIDSQALVRLAPMVAPVMHRMNLTTHYFFVPNRILWQNWEKFIAQTKDMVTDQVPIAPTLGRPSNFFSSYVGGLADHMGLPISDRLQYISAFCFAAYQCIYNAYYRDQNLIPEVPFLLQDGNQSSDMYGVLSTLRKRAWQHDYFTASLPFAQKGSPVDIPLGAVALENNWNGSGNTPKFNNFANVGDIGGALSTYDPPGAVTAAIQSPTNGPLAYDPQGTLVVDPTTITDLRRAFKLQEWLEKTARGGSRYIEMILMHFGVRSSDSRLQRPEYITGSKTPITISEVLNTTGDAGGAEPLPQGNMAGHGIAVGQSYGGSYYAEEHGYIIGISSITAETAYQQGIPRHFMKTDPFDYYWPSFAHIGEQEVYNAEIYQDDAVPVEPKESGTFGYIPRYAEYKYQASRVAGDFRETLNYWHLGRIFDAPPVLNQSFVESSVSNRIFAVEDPNTDHFYCQIHNKISASRLMDFFGSPKM